MHNVLAFIIALLVEFIVVFLLYNVHPFLGYAYGLKLGLGIYERVYKIVQALQYAKAVEVQVQEDRLQKLKGE